MQRQFSQPAFSPAPDRSSYLYEDPKPPVWRRLLPLLVLMAAGAAACYGGLSAGKKMAGEITQLDTAQAAPQLTQRVVIGADNPDLMMAQPTFAPPSMIVVSQPKPVQRVPRRVSIAPKTSKPAPDPFSDHSIPFRPAEDYAPEDENSHVDSDSLKHETVTHQSSVEEDASAKTELTSAAPEEQTPEPAPQESGSPVPVAG